MDATAIVVAIITAIPTSALIYFRWKDGKVIRDTHSQVVTLNESTIGELMAGDETRRIAAIPYDNRTVQEQRHLMTSPAQGPPQGPPHPRMADRLAHVDERVEQVHHAVNGDDDDDDPKPSLYELVEGLAAKVGRLEQSIGLPPE